MSRRPSQAQNFIENLRNGVTLEMVFIPGGTFLMGSPGNEGNQTEKPQHRVTIEPFLIAKYPITQKQWQQVASFAKLQRELKWYPSDFKGEKLPVEKVSWYDVVEWCGRLSQKVGRAYRLPSEAEWEYAARGGTTTAFYVGDSLTTDIANYYDRKGVFRQQTTPVDQFQHENPFGLCDIHGNVFEWCADPWHDNYNNAPSDGRVWDNQQIYDNYLENLADLLNSNEERVVRGGSWDTGQDKCRCANRWIASPEFPSVSYGFRPCLSSLNMIEVSAIAYAYQKHS
ncbi:hypothetical protein B9T07_15370 [Limnospira fusiformis CCALA 023]|uniref:formylglycine-generating enzyme family protein n=1 Tax=Oscillatoriales TaxID=1150 RepID=UPI0012CD1CB0|nr:formylglycine-generating enzyme family protein [Arthrospira sp. PLM2.Bin9]TVU52955.1 MAG: formylglycine-generating enzyme family protein [Arthrospira sp. PLM2.Bin9]